jgi:hypothetical protein
MNSLKTYSARIDGDRIMVDPEARLRTATDVPFHGMFEVLISLAIQDNSYKSETVTRKIKPVRKHSWFCHGTEATDGTTSQ